MTLKPEWAPALAEKLAELKALKDGWDGHDGVPLRADVEEFTLGLVMTHMKDMPAPQAVPLSSGGLQLEWYETGHEVELEIDEPGHMNIDITLKEVA